MSRRYLFYVGCSLGGGLHEDEAVLSGEGLSLLLLHLSPGLQVTMGTTKTLDIYSTIDLRYASTVLCFAPNDLLIHSVTFAS